MAIQALFRMGRGARFDIDEFDSPNGSYLASRPHDRVVFSPLLSIAGSFLPIALFGILAALVDRLPLKRVLIGTDLFIAAVGAALTIASLAGSLPAWLILIALFLRAVGTSFYTPASQSLTPHLAPPEHLVRLSGVTQAIQSGGYILGAALAAVIYPVAGITAMIVLDVLGALFASLAVLAAQIDAGGLDEADRSLPFSNKVRELFSEISDGYKLIRGYRGCSPFFGAGSSSLSRSLRSRHCSQ